MIDQSRTSQKVARIENKFIFNAQYKLGVREQKVMLYLIANINPNKDDFEECLIPVKELETVLKSDGKKWGGIYQEMEHFCSNIINRKITFNSDVLIDNKPMRGYINWFQSVYPTYNDKKEVCIRFLFSSDLKPFLLKLKEYARINRLEVARMRSTYSIRLFQIFKALREKHRKHKKEITISYPLVELKELLGISDKYPRFNNFRQRVLNPSKKEINEQTSLYVDMAFLRNGKKQVDRVQFRIRDNGAHQTNFNHLVDEVNKTEIKSQIHKSPVIFDFEKFKMRYPEIYQEILLKVERQYKALNIPLKNREQMIQNSVVSHCEHYFRQYLT